MNIQTGTTLELNSKKYIIKERIDEGGNGTVWKAEREGDNHKTYAIKVLSDNANKNKLLRFEHECQFCKDTSHVHIIKVHDFIAEKGNAYCVMPYYSRNLRSVIDNENDPFILLNYIIQLCEAICYIHKQGIIHRDLKPENILVSDDNTLVLTDFGIAHFEDSLVTKRRDWLGNRRYAAPEQLATDEVDTACDIYSLGRIMNELFTKQNPSGESFLTIADKAPLLLPLDGIVQKCRTQDPVFRPSINEILMELYLLEGEIKEKLADITEAISPIENSISSNRQETIILQAAKDVLSAQYIFAKISDEKLDELNVLYHRNILYDMDKPIQNLLFQTHVFDFCKRKFNCEAVPYNNGQSYQALNLDDEIDRKLYDELNVILDAHKTPYVCRDITARIRKLFCSCYKYHCVELLADVKEECQRESQLAQAPILHIVYILRKELSKHDLKEIVISDHIAVNWKSNPKERIEEPEIFINSQHEEEEKILNVLRKRYDVTYAKDGHNHYYVRFQTMDAFNAFKQYALELSRPYYIFEGDVLDLIRVRRNYHGIVELESLDSFEVTSTLAKILEIRTDY